MGSLICGVILVVLVVFMLVNRDKINAAATTKPKTPHELYQESLAALKQDPTNPDLKQATLALGRTYANATRNKKGVTIFDEMALMNDISAATAGASTINAVPMKASVPERLRQLDELKTNGLVSEEEWTTRRQKILEEL